MCAQAASELLGRVWLAAYGVVVLFVVGVCACGLFVSEKEVLGGQLLVGWFVGGRRLGVRVGLFDDAGRVDGGYACAGDRTFGYICDSRGEKMWRTEF